MPAKRGEIYWVEFDPVKGSEQGGLRPALVVQNDVGNRHSPTTVVVAVTRTVPPCFLADSDFLRQLHACGLGDENAVIRVGLVAVRRGQDEIAAGLQELDALQLETVDKGLSQLVSILGAQTLPPKVILSEEINLSRRLRRKKAAEQEAGIN